MVRFDPEVPRKYLVGHLLWFLSWLGITGVAMFLRPDPAGHGTHHQLGLPPCPTILMFGKPCPSCGLTTSFTSTVHGDLLFAFTAHPLGPILYGLFTASAFACIYGFVQKKRFNTDSKAFNVFMIVSLVVFLGYGSWRFFASGDLREQRGYAAGVPEENAPADLAPPNQAE